MSHRLVPTALRRHHAQTVRDSSFQYKIDYFIMIKNFLMPEGHENPICGSTITAILLKGLILLTGGASAVEVLRSTVLPCLVCETRKFKRHSVFWWKVNLVKENWIYIWNLVFDQRLQFTSVQNPRALQKKGWRTKKILCFIYVMMNM